MAQKLRGISSGRTFQARYHGTCDACGGRYLPGAWIYGQGKGHKAVHWGCRPDMGLTIRPLTELDKARLLDARSAKSIRLAAHNGRCARCAGRIVAGRSLVKRDVEGRYVHGGTCP